MASPDQKRTSTLYHGDPPLAVDVALAFVFAVATFLSIAMATGGSLPAVAAAQLIGLGAMPILTTRVRRRPLADLGLIVPPTRAIAGAALIGVAIWYVDLRLVAPLSRWLGDHGESTRELSTLVTTTPIATIVVLSVVPGLCEELACRGLLGLGLAARLGAPLAIAISAAAFAALHVSLVRAAPTFLLGVILGIVTIRSRSVVPAMLAHALNNLIALSLAAGYLRPLWTAIEAGPDVALGVAIGLVTVGIGIAWRRS
ncbi:MAG: CPBP family intramembrane metalloprotease [Kofleriaceae bacterium]|nr:CPBP family intramembrane metalloprotease [Kofleriaceae bacterium]MCB9572090.1 CPBP family intramembrane metalloprotease [Kofleriaceae bacterium]